MRTTAVLIRATLLALALAGCSDSRSEAPAGSSTTAGPPAAAGSIAVRVTYAGPPDIETLRINKDVEQCGREARIARILVGGGHGLAHAVASVAGLDGPPATHAAQLDQKGCEFRPHVVAMRTGEIEIRNSDGILHNIHTYSTVNTPINKAQPGFKKVMTETFGKPEVIKITCDVHSWMLGWLVVMPHRHFGVTDERGAARIDGVPVGTHTVEVWHETLGKLAKDVTVKPDATTDVAFEFVKGG